VQHGNPIGLVKHLGFLDGNKMDELSSQDRQEGVEARELRSLAEVQAAASAGEVAITQPGIVVNMPILVWPGGSR